MENAKSMTRSQCFRCDYMDNEYSLFIRMKDGTEIELMRGATKATITDAMDDFECSFLNNSLWLLVSNSNPIFINPSQIQFVERRCYSGLS